MHYFTGNHDQGAEALLQTAMRELSDQLAGMALPGLSGVFLGGGYGRGEGGVRHLPDGRFTLYNDLDFIVVAESGAGRRARRRIAEALAAIGRQWRPRLGIDVDFSKPMTARQLRRNARTLMMQELLRGHVAIFGDSRLLGGCIPAMPPEELPAMEAMRLMLNRGMGLLLAGERLSAYGGVPRDQASADFINRNMNKCVLGMGDAWLIFTRRYRWDIRDRAVVLSGAAPEDAGALGALYPQAVELKFSPSSSFLFQTAEAIECLRGMWLSMVCALLQLPPPGIPRPPSVRRQLHQFCRRQHACSPREFLRWTLRSRTLDFSRSAFDDPVARVLALLYEAHARGGAFPASARRRLQRLWSVFN